MELENKILEKLDQLTSEVAQLRAASNGNGNSAKTPAGLPALPADDPQAELMAQLRQSSESLTKLLKSVDQMMELKEDLVPLGRPMMEEAIRALDQATQGFDASALREFIRQFTHNLSALAEAIRMVGALMELKGDSAQILMQAFDDLVVRLEELKQKGFFDSMTQLVNMGELVGQKLLELDTDNIKPVKGLSGLYRTLQRKDVQEGLGIAVELLAALAVLKQKRP